MTTQRGDVIAWDGERLEVVARAPLIVYVKDKNGREAQKVAGLVLHTRATTKELTQPSGGIT